MAKKQDKTSKRIKGVNTMLVDLLIKSASIMKAITMFADLLNLNGEDLDRLDIEQNGELLPGEGSFNRAVEGIAMTCETLYASINKMLEALNKSFIGEGNGNQSNTNKNSD